MQIYYWDLRARLELKNFICCIVIGSVFLSVKEFNGNVMTPTSIGQLTQPKLCLYEGLPSYKTDVSKQIFNLI